MSNCPNIEVCKLVTTEGFTGNENLRHEYIRLWCKSGEEMWGQCKRYVVKNALNFCPDFVLPDTQMSPEEVIDKFDEENE